MTDNSTNLQSKRNDTYPRFPKWVKWGVIISLLLSIGAFISTFIQVNVTITHETYVGTMVTILGVIIAIVLGYQLVNYISFEKKINETIDNRINLLETNTSNNVDNKWNSIKDELAIYKVRIRIDFMLPLLRNSLITDDWEFILNNVLILVEDVNTIGDSASARFITELFSDFIAHKEIDYSHVTKSTLIRLIKAFSGLKNVVGSDSHVLLKSIDDIIYSFIKEVQTYE